MNEKTREQFAQRRVAELGAHVRVAAERCATCIFGPNSALQGRPTRLRDLADGWRAKDAHQVCHQFGVAGELDGDVEEDEDEAPLDGENVVCRGWWDTQPGSTYTQLGERIGVTQFVPLPPAAS